MALTSRTMSSYELGGYSERAKEKVGRGDVHSVEQKRKGVRCCYRRAVRGRASRVVVVESCRKRA